MIVDTVRNLNDRLAMVSNIGVVLFSGNNYPTKQMRIALALDVRANSKHTTLNY